MKIKAVSLIVTGVIALPLLLAGCGASAADAIPQELQGHWVDVNGSTSLDIDGKKMTADTLKEMLRSTGADVHIELRIDEKADFGLFVTVLDELRELHHENFSIATEKAEL